MGTAIQGLGAAELSYQKAYDYAVGRGSMRALSGTKKPNLPADPIIYHPDVRRMLLTQKAIAEGGRAMVYACAKLADVMTKAQEEGDTEAAKKMDDRLGFMTPILKGFLSEKGVEAANMGIQIWGGHGYITDNGMEQIVRDSRISAVWEGTTGIQGLDLLGRKVMLQKLNPINQNNSEIYSYIFKICTGPHRKELGKYATTLLRHTLRWHFNTGIIAVRASGDREVIGSAAVDYLMYGGYNTMAYMWLKMAEAALEAKKNGLTNGTAAVQDETFYNAKLDTCEFFFDRILPLSQPHSVGMLASSQSVLKLDIEGFNKAYNV